jgi:hypothetical protein
MFRVAPPLELKKLEVIFRHKVFRILLAKGKITEVMIRRLSAWRHSGFHVFCGNRISPRDETALENLARYIIQASFSQERLARARPPPKIHDPPVCVHSTGRPTNPVVREDLCCQLPVNDDHFYRDPEYAWDDYVQA